ncbi:MAG: hypothetical protein AB1646_00105 [Thermodesulfobacteriota bacterium]
MGVLPVPDEVRAMANGIDKLVAAINIQNALLEKIHSSLTEIKSGATTMKTIAEKMDGMHGTVQAARDSLRMLCSTMEKKF